MDRIVRVVLTYKYRIQTKQQQIDISCLESLQAGFYPIIYNLQVYLPVKLMLSLR